MGRLYDWPYGHLAIGPFGHVQMDLSGGFAPRSICPLAYRASEPNGPMLKGGDPPFKTPIRCDGPFDLHFGAKILWTGVTLATPKMDTFNWRITIGNTEMVR